MAGLYGDTVVVVFRGDGIARDVGHYAGQVFGALGSAGGHKSMARAEFSAAVAQGKDLELFIWQQFTLAGRSGKGGKDGAAPGRSGDQGAPLLPGSETESASSAEDEDAVFEGVS